MNAELAAKHERLKADIRALGRVLVAFSGGVDSSLVAYVAAETLGANALAVTSGSLSLKRSDLKLATELAERWGMQHRVIVTDELTKADYRANPRQPLLPLQDLPVRILGAHRRRRRLRSRP